MPGCDGLTVVQEARKCVPGLEVIVISGYAQFDYAQTAIRFGVGEYLLKPINRDALNHSLEKMAVRCRARQKQETEMESLLVSRDDDRQRLRTQLIADLLGGCLDAPDEETLARTYRFTAANGLLQLLMLKMDYHNDDFSDASLTIVREKALDLFQPTLDSLCIDALLHFSGASMGGIAEKLHLNPAYLGQLVRRYTGATFHRQLLDTRLEHACVLLRQTSLPVGEIAMDVGFRDVDYFSQQFRGRLGMAA